MHTTVFLNEAVSALDVRKKGTYIDATYGKGGHSKKIVEMGGTVLAIEWDPVQIPKEKQNRIEIARGNYADIAFISKQYSFSPVDGILFDFGLSMDQLNEGKKGLSYRKLDEKLDMRISNEGITAQEVLATYSEEELIDSFMKYSEEIKSKDIARQIIITRKHKPIETVEDLRAVIDKAIKSLKDSKEYAQKVYSRIFQALRIIVNEEFNNIDRGLEGALQIVKPGGRIVVITFHSLEDRIVKLFARHHKSEVREWKVDVERERSLRSFERSAMLRVIEKKK